MHGLYFTMILELPRMDHSLASVSLFRSVVISCFAETKHFLFSSDGSYVLVSAAGRCG